MFRQRTLWGYVGRCGSSTNLKGQPPPANSWPWSIMSSNGALTPSSGSALSGAVREHSDAGPDAAAAPLEDYRVFITIDCSVPAVFGPR